MFIVQLNIKFSKGKNKGPFKYLKTPVSFYMIRLLILLMIFLRWALFFLRKALVVFYVSDKGALFLKSEQLAVCLWLGHNMVQSVWLQEIRQGHFSRICYLSRGGGGTHQSLTDTNFLNKIP